MIAASAPIDRTDIAFIICFLVHKEPGVYRVALSEPNRNQDAASCPRDFSPMRLGAAKTATNSTGRKQRDSRLTPLPPVQTQAPRRFALLAQMFQGLAHRRAGNFDHASERMIHLQDDKNRTRNRQRRSEERRVGKEYRNTQLR